MAELIPVNKIDDIFPEYRNSPISLLLEYQNLNKTFCSYKKPSLLLGVCMDNPANLWIPDNFAYVISTGGANLFYNEFQVSFAIGVGGVKHIALVGHAHCQMENMVRFKDDFVKGLAENAGWKPESAERHFDNLSPFFEIGETQSFLEAETERLRKRYPKVTVAPLFFKEKDNKLYQIKC